MKNISSREKLQQNYTREKQTSGPPCPPRSSACIFRKHPRQKANFSDFFAEDSLQDSLKSKSTSRRGRILVEKRRVSPRGEPKIHKSEQLKGDQQFAHEVKNLSKSPSMMVYCPKCQPPKSHSRIRFFVISGQGLGVGARVFFSNQIGLSLSVILKVTLIFVCPRGVL